MNLLAQNFTNFQELDVILWCRQQINSLTIRYNKNYSTICNLIIVERSHLFTEPFRVCRIQAFCVCLLLRRSPNKSYKTRYVNNFISELFKFNCKWKIILKISVIISICYVKKLNAHLVVTLINIHRLYSVSILYGVETKQASIQLLHNVH